LAWAISARAPARRRRAGGRGDAGTQRAPSSRGGRADLAGPHLARVEAPTLRIVGGLDREVVAR
jgi:hypothetical protein